MSSSLSALKCVLVCFAVAFFVFAGNTYAQQTVTCETHTPSDPPTDKDALIAIYCATDGAGWGSGRNADWLTDEPLNDWFGVTATDPDISNPTPNDNSDDQVTELHLGNRTYLHGELPPEIGNLTSLTRLEISYNRHGSLQRYLTGSIPPELGNLTNLTELILHNNTRLSGSIPLELGSLTNLTKLEIYNCDLTGSIPPELGNLSNLAELELYLNKLTGPIPRELGKLGSLTRLTLDRNKLTGSIPPELGNLGNPDPSDPNSSSGFNGLFLLDDNQLSGPIPPELGRLDSALQIWLHNNQLSGPIPSELGEMSSLETLIIFNNQLTGPLPVELFSMDALHTLELDNNRIDGEIPPPSDTEAGPELSRLYLQNNQLSGEIPPELTNLTKLTALNLSENNLTGSIPPEFGTNKSVPPDPDNPGRTKCLGILELQGNQLTGAIPPKLALDPEDPGPNCTLPQNVALNLSRNQLTGDIPAGLWDMPELEELHLNDNQLTWTTPPTESQLEALTMLEQLYLQNNMLTDTIPLAGLEALTVDDSDPPEPTTTFRELALWGNPGLGPTAQQMSDDLVKRVDRAVLRALYEGTNGLNWERRSKFISNFSGSWTWFGTERFVENDPIFEFWRLPGVTVNGDGRVASLDLSNNNLVGEINDALGELGGLQTLDLSGNPSLRGTLPQGLIDSSELETVNIQCTGISTPADADFHTWLGTINFTGRRCPSFRPPAPPPPPAPEPIDPSEDDMEELKVFYRETGGENWTNNTNWLSENEPLSQWYGVTVNNEERVTALDLPGNGLSGSIPPLLGHLVSELETLNLADNPMLSGMLPLSLMNLSELEALNIEGTGACAPEDAAFQQWLGTITFQGNVCARMEDDEGACAIAGTGNTPENAVFNLLLIILALIAVSWKSSSGARRTQHSG